MAVIKFNFLSKYLGMQTNVTICLPSFSFDDVMNGREETYVKGMKYQSLLLLHGGSGDDSDYVNFSNIVRYADDHKLAVVMPAAYNSDYADNPKGPRYLKYIAEELPLVMQSIFPISDRREDSFIGGLSMGAHGAMKIALLYPERYQAALIMSGAARHPDSIGEMGKMFKRMSKDPDAIPMPDMSAIYGDLADFADSRHNAYRQATENVLAKKWLPQFFFTCGDKDFALDRCRQGYEELTSLGYKTAFDRVPGYSHEWDFWDLSLKKAFQEWLPIRHQVIYPE